MRVPAAAFPPAAGTAAAGRAPLPMAATRVLLLAAALPPLAARDAGGGAVEEVGRSRRAAGYDAVLRRHRHRNQATIDKLVSIMRAKAGSCAASSAAAGPRDASVRRQDEDTRLLDGRQALGSSWQPGHSAGNFLAHLEHGHKPRTPYFVTVSNDSDNAVRDANRLGVAAEPIGTGGLAKRLAALVSGIVLQQNGTSRRPESVPQDSDIGPAPPARSSELSLNGRIGKGQARKNSPFDTLKQIVGPGGSVVGRLHGVKRRSVVPALDRLRRILVGQYGDDISAKAKGVATSFLQDDNPVAVQGDDRDTVKLHVAATAYNDDADRHVVFLGLQGLPETNASGQPIYTEATICWCDGGAFLNIQGMSFKITSFMQEGQVMCMGCAEIAPTIRANFKSNCPDKNIYTVLLEAIPNTPFKVLLDSIDPPPDDDGLVTSASVMLVPGDSGLLVPGWLCLRSGLEVFIGELSLGCISRIDTGSQQVLVAHQTTPVQPLVTEVSFQRDDGSAESFALPSLPRDQTEDLAYAMMDYLERGDAEITICGGDLAGGGAAQ